MMKYTLPLFVLVFLLSGCTKKVDDKPKNKEPVVLMEQAQPPETEEIFPPLRDGVLTDDDLFFTESPPKTFSQATEFLVEQPEFAETETPPLMIDTVDTTWYLEDGGKFWDAIYVGSVSVGFQSTEFSKEIIQDHQVNCVIVHNHIRVPHLETPGEISAEHRSLETLQGEFLGSQSKIERDGFLIEQVAKVIDDTLQITLTLGEQTTQQELPWKIGARTGGVCEIQVSLLKNPMQDSEERRVSFYDPTRQAIIDATLVAKEIETVELPNQTVNLRRIETIFKAPQEQIPITLWTDSVGNIIRMVQPLLQTETLTTIRTTEDAIQMINDK